MRPSLLDQAREIMKPNDPASNKKFYQKAFHILSGSPENRQTSLSVLNKLASAVVNLFIIGALLLLAFWAMDRRAPVTFENRKIVTEVVRDGEKIEIVADRTRYRLCPLLRTESYRDGDGTLITKPAQSIPALGTATSVTEKAEKLEFTPPKEMTPGDVQVGMTLMYYCNPLQRAMNWPIVVVLPTLRFKLLPANVNKAP